MKRQTTLFWMLASLCLLTVWPVSAQENAFTLNSDPIIGHSAMTEWDGRFTAAGAVTYHDGQFHMFRNGYRAWLAPSKVAYHVSDDGINWTQVGDFVFEVQQMPFFDDTALVTSAVVEADGTWTFYLALFSQSEEFVSGIARATATTPTSEWVVDEQLVLNTGPEGAWDSAAIVVSDVLRTDAGYEMYYAAYDDAGVWGIGRATSADGIAWEKHNDPTTDSTAYAESDPVMVAEADEAWENEIQDPRITVVDGQYVMLYTSYSAGRNAGFGLAVSADGLAWQRVANNPVLSSDAFRRNAWFPEFIYQDGTYYLYIEADSRAGTDIFVATYADNLTLADN